MAELQYIGARYVPKFFGGTSGTDWLANTSYEALTIVTRNGNSYTSKIPVPANIGAPEDNPHYWVSTGIFNAQIEQYREEVEEINARTGIFTTPEEFGAVGDGSTNDTSAVEQCIRYAIANNKIVLLSKRYAIQKINLTDITPRIYGLTMVGSTSNDSGELNDNIKQVGFNSLATDYAFDFPITHNAQFENFSINCINGCTAFRFAGGYLNNLYSVDFGKHGRAVEILTGSYWHFSDCTINTDDDYAFFVNINTSGVISDAEYILFENCQIAHNKTNYSGTAFKTTGNNFTSFIHCDFIGWNNAIANVGSKNSKAIKIIDSQLGANHLFGSNSQAGFNGFIVNSCNIHISNYYFDTADNTILSNFNFTNNLIYTAPDSEVFFEDTAWQDNWVLKNNSYPGDIPPFTNVNCTSGLKPAKHDAEHFYKTGASGTELTAGTYTASVTLKNNITSGAPIYIRASSCAYNSTSFNDLVVSNVSVNGNNLSMKLQGGTGSSVQNVIIIVEY